MKEKGGWLRLTAVIALCAPIIGANGADDRKAAFSLPSIDGRNWVRPGAFTGKPAVFLFWDTECAPCLRELQHLSDLQGLFPGAAFVAVSLSPAIDTRRVLAKFDVSPAVISALAPANPRGLLAQLGNRAGVLPFAVVFRGNGERCLYGAGPLSREFLQRAAASCSQ